MQGIHACFLYAALILLTVFSSCKKELQAKPDDPVPHALQLEVPENFPPVVDQPDNPLTEEGVELGRRLFYDVRLSGNNKISCASCHRQDLAFTDGLALSDAGVSGTKLDRHAPPLFNLAWSGSGLFWDGGSKNLESQAFGPLTAADEMHQDLLHLETELKAIPDYIIRFKHAFNDEIKSAYIVKALAQFQRTLISGTSKYDRFKRKEPGGALSDLERQGMLLMEQKCKDCHSGELFTDDGYHNNGLDDIFGNEHEGIFQGRFRVTFDPEDMGKFKTPSLRNVMLTAPYMHDGRFKNMSEVLDHYQSGVKTSATLDRLMLQNAGQPGIHLTGSERQAILAFLGVLSDDKFINNEKISNPYE